MQVKLLKGFPTKMDVFGMEGTTHFNGNLGFNQAREIIGELEIPDMLIYCVKCELQTMHKPLPEPPKEKK